MGKRIMHCHWFNNAQSHHASHSLHHISMHCICDVLPEQESVQAISPSQRSWIDWPLSTHMPFITNSNKRFSKTNWTDPRQRFLLKSDYQGSTFPLPHSSMISDLVCFTFINNPSTQDIWRNEPSK